MMLSTDFSVSVGSQGSGNVASVFNHSKFAQAVENSANPLAIPPAKVVPDTDIEIPMLFVADEAYPLRPYLMKPFSSRGLTSSERIFNYRLSRPRRAVENAFGILVNRFRILRRNMQFQPETVCKVVMACCSLHNFLRSKMCNDIEIAEEMCNTDSAVGTVDNVRHVARSTG